MDYIAREQRAVFKDGRLRGRPGRRVSCGVCGKDVALYASGYMWEHGKYGHRGHGVTDYSSSNFAPCAGTGLWNARVAAMIAGGLDRSLPRYHVIDNAHGKSVEWTTHGRTAAASVAAEWNEREGAWDHKRFTIKRA